MASCCGGPPAPQKTGSKREPAKKFDLLHADFRHAPPAQESCCGAAKDSFDYILWGSLALMAVAAIVYVWFPTAPLYLTKFSTTCVELAQKSWWAIAAGIGAMAVLSQTPKELIAAVLGKPGSMNGILRATLAGVLLDLCNHGILMVGVGLYKRGASLGQTIAFLIASPWNSFSLTLLLAALIGVKWTLLILLLSAVIGIITGYLVELLTKAGHLPANVHSISLPAEFSYRAALHQMAKDLSPRPRNLLHLFKIGLRDSRMVVRWLLLGFIMTGLVKAFVADQVLHQHFGPTLLGLLLTLLATSLLEVCSEGSSPLAAELFHTAHAPGNAFAFLMAGAATDYTEVLVLKNATGRWLCALILPILAVPQVLVIGYLLNQFR